MTVRSILLVTSNGFGMGHLVRQIAIRSAMPADVRCTILTLSGAAPIAIEAGVELEYCPSYTRFDKRAWHRGYLADRIQALATEVKADVVLFDGVVPYTGLLTALSRLDVAAVWMRRGVWRSSAKRWPLSYSGMFDLILEPGDVGAGRDQGPTSGRSDARRLGVITQAGGSAMVSRQEAATRLGVDPNRPTLLVNIGSNRIADLDVLEHALASDPRMVGWNVITTRDALGRNRSDSSGIHVVTGIFPLHPYLSAVDLAVTSVGYNAAHEFLACGVPTVVVPADNATDDQYARADAMADIGAAVVCRAEYGQDLVEAVAPLMQDSDARQKMSSAALTYATSWGDGAAQAVAALLDIKRGGPSFLPRMRHAGRMAIERLLGIVSRRRMLRVRFTETLSMADVAGEEQIEHLHPGLGSGYRQRREVIAARWGSARTG